MSKQPLLVAHTVVEAFRICFGNIGIFARALAIPIFAMSVTVIFWRGQVTALSAALQLLLALWWAGWFTLFAITCHRLALLGPDGVPPFGHLRMGQRELGFLGRLLALTVAVPILAFVGVYLILATLFPDVRMGVESTGISPWLGWAVFLAVIYFLGRWSLVFPAAAMDQPISFATAWAYSRENGWRLAVLVGFIPAALEIARSLLLRANATAFELVLNVLIGYALLAAEIVALSLAYRTLRRHA